jgi:hypothetical protein
MTVDDFNWFLHCLLFLYTQQVIRKQEKARTGEEVNEDEEIQDEGIDIEDEQK